MDWAALVLICFVLPAVLSVLFCEIERKLGWIKDGVVECLAIALSEPLQNQFIRFSVHWSHG